MGDLDREDYYKFTPTAGQTVSFTPDEEAAPLDVAVYDADQQRIWREKDVGPTVNKTFQIGEVAGGPYYIGVAGQGRYTVEIK